MHVKKKYPVGKRIKNMAFPLWARDGVYEWGGFHHLRRWVEKEERDLITEYISDPSNAERYNKIKEIYQELDKGFPGIEWGGYKELKKIRHEISEETGIPESILERSLKECYRHVEGHVKKKYPVGKRIKNMAFPLWARDGVYEWGGFHHLRRWVEKEDREMISQYISDPKHIESYNELKEIYKELDEGSQGLKWNGYKKLEEIEYEISEETGVPESVVERSLEECVMGR